MYIQSRVEDFFLKFVRQNVILKVYFRLFLKLKAQAFSVRI